MIEVRVSEETPNLSHPSNLISAVRLENSSPSLMRLIKASGRTHSWEVVRGSKNLGEMSEKEKKQETLGESQEVLGEMPRTRERALGEMPRAMPKKGVKEILVRGQEAFW
jgi:hypothetical protein